MAKLIFRIKKLTHKGNIAASVSHATRELSTPNADASRSHLNQIAGTKSTGEFLGALDKRLEGVKIPRSDSPLVLEYLIGASEDYFKGEDKGGKAFFDDARAWLEKTHGKENVLMITVHYDETTPHLSAFVVPMVLETNQLSAKLFLGGKKKLSDLQTDCWRDVAASRGIERGLIGSMARHVNTNEWKAAIKAETTFQEVIAPAPPGFADRLDPQAWAQPTIDAANEKLRQAALKVAAANQKQKAVKIEAARLAEKASNITLREQNLEVTVAERVKAATDTLKMHLLNVNSENQMLTAAEQRAHQSLQDTIKATATLIKTAYKGADLIELCRQMEIEPPVGKADIFDAVRKSWRAQNFTEAVVFVSRQINFNEEVRLNEIEEQSERNQYQSPSL
jgi:hypothetical protein